MNNFFKYQEFRKIYPEFHYHGYDVSEREDSLDIIYHFSIPGLTEFKPEWKIPKKKKNGQVVSYLQDMTQELKENRTLQKLIFSLGMVELISYWKIACPKKVLIHLSIGDILSEKELSWWKEQYFHGLGEFFHTNEIPLDEKGFMEMELIREEEPESISCSRERGLFEFVSGRREGEAKDLMAPLTLVPIGGGKDSIVTLELLNDQKENNYCFMINGRGATLDTVRVAGYTDEQNIIVKRSLDSEMLRLNNEGFLNGHTPFSAIVAFSTVLISYLYGLPYVALSNEGSANESTVEGSTVNHQYSKSFKFEMDFFNYENTYVKSGVHYFSLLRGWSEYRIAKNFAKHKKYHKIFRSCNVGSKENKWCAHCPKCLFVYLLLGAFLSQEELMDVFGSNMLNDVSMWEDMRKLVGELPEKPFECVGSREEVNIAVCETIQRMEKAGEELPKLFTLYMETKSYEAYKDKGDEELLAFSTEHNIPTFLIEKVK